MGVDGARGGWVAATRDGVRGHARLADVLAAHPRAVLFVDIPIGLGEGDRACDKEARRALGPRRASVFPPPSRAQLALAGTPWRPGLGLNRQTHALLPKIAEADALARDPRHGPRLREAHPELAFLLAGGGRALAPKRSPEGRAQRERILRRLRLRFDADGLDVSARRDDVDDAAILVWLGEEALAGRIGHYGEPPLVIWGAPAHPSRVS